MPKLPDATPTPPTCDFLWEGGIPLDPHVCNLDVGHDGPHNCGYCGWYRSEEHHAPA